MGIKKQRVFKLILAILLSSKYINKNMQKITKFYLDLYYLEQAN